MKVAIIGAGLAGLACAHELERFGIRPVVYERNAFIGEQHPHISAILEITHRPIKDCIEYFNRLGINVKPYTTVNTIVHNGPSKTTVLHSDFGYMFKRDKGHDDLKNQIYSLLDKTEVKFNAFGDYESLINKFDYIVIANGTTDYTRELGVWKGWVNTYVKGAIVLGSFDPNTLIVWINKDYCKNGYAYLTPFNDKRASLAVVVTDVSEQEIESYWELFLYTENIKYTITQEFTLNHRAGHVYPHRVGNIYFAGNSGGVIDPFLGFGQFGAITTGVMAARSIAAGYDYENLIKEVVGKNIQLHEFRKGFDRLNNTGCDILMSTLGLPGLRHLLYNSRINVIKYGSAIVKLLPKKE